MATDFMQASWRMGPLFSIAFLADGTPCTKPAFSFAFGTSLTANGDVIATKPIDKCLTDVGILGGHFSAQVQLRLVSVYHPVRPVPRFDESSRPDQGFHFLKACGHPTGPHGFHNH